MADIGSTLRETRIREKIDITTVEEGTKIRAKYLRALENEEWGVLPGPAYVKSFLRTYAEFLGLDAHMLVEDYRVRYEEPEELELPAFRRNHELRGRVRPPGPPSRGTAVAVLALALLAILFVLGVTSGSDDGGKKQREAARRVKGGAKSKSGRQQQSASPGGTTAPAGKVTVSVVATRPVWVCLVDAGGRQRIEGRTLAAGSREGPFRSERFLVTLGNGGGQLRVNGSLQRVPEKPVPVGYAVTRSGLRPLPASKRPTCAPGQGQGSGATGGAGASTGQSIG